MGRHRYSRVWGLGDWTGWAGIWSASVLAAAGQTDNYCQILDRLEKPVWEVYGAYAEEVPGDQLNTLGMVEAGFYTGWFYHRGNWGTLDVRSEIDTLTFSGKGPVEIPSTVARAYVDMDYVARLQDGVSFRLGLAPGLYSDVSDLGSDSFFYPFRLHAVRVLSPDSSGMVGLDFYPGFDRLLHPRIGARWVVSDYMSFDFFYPESRLNFRPTWWLGFHAGVYFNDHEEYRLKKGDDRKGLMVRETRMFLGVEFALTSQIHLMMQVGRIADRSIEFRQNAPQVNLEDAYFGRLGIGGRI